MQRIGHVWRLRPGKAEEYDERHREIWPELAARLREEGVREYHIYRWGEILFSHMVVEDYAALIAGFAGDSVSQRWEAQMADLLLPDDTPDGWPETLTHVWSLADQEGEKQT
jgi:L-rhamnose mutarotase